jgi:hypothetical protein
VDQGKATYYNKIDKAITSYLEDNLLTTSKAYTYFSTAFIAEKSTVSDNLEIVVHLHRLPLQLDLIVGIVIRDERNVPLVGVNNEHYFQEITNGLQEELALKIVIPKLPLLPGKYALDLFIDDRKGVLHEEWQNALFFSVYNQANINVGRLNNNLNKILIKEISWKIIDR